MIKVPGTDAGVQAFEELTASGVNVNVTLLFSVSRYREVAEAYMRGLERRVEQGEPMDRTASVASFFVSRVDTKVDDALEKAGREDLRGRAAVANAKLAYAAFERDVPRGALGGAGLGRRREQRPLWASTSHQEPGLPGHALRGRADRARHRQHDARRDDRRGARAGHRGADDRPRRGRGTGAHQAVEDAGVDVEDIVLRQLPDEGVKTFADAYESLIETLEEKARRLNAVAG